MKTKIFFLIMSLLIISCSPSTNHKHDGSYSLNINTFGINVNSKVDLIINGDKVKYNGEIKDCKQYADRVEIGKAVFNAVDGDLIVNVPMLGKARYVRVSGDNNLKQ